MCVCACERACACERETESTESLGSSRSPIFWLVSDACSQLVFSWCLQQRTISAVLDLESFFSPSQHVLGEVSGVNMACFKVLIYAIKCLGVFRGCCSSSILLSDPPPLSTHFKHNSKSSIVYSHSPFFRLCVGLGCSGCSTS